MFITCSGIFYQFLYPVQEFRLKIDTLKKGTSRIGLYGSAPRVLFEPSKCVFRILKLFHSFRLTMMKGQASDFHARGGGTLNVEVIGMLVGKFFGKP